MKKAKELLIVKPVKKFLVHYKKVIFVLAALLISYLLFILLVPVPKIAVIRADEMLLGDPVGEVNRQLLEAMKIQIFENLVGNKHRLIGEVLLEKEYITTSQIDEVHNFLGISRAS